MEDNSTCEILIHISSRIVSLYMDEFLLAEISKHAKSWIDIEPSGDNVYPGYVSIRNKGSFEFSCKFSKLCVNFDCLEYISKPIDGTLIDIIGVVV